MNFSPMKNLMDRLTAWRIPGNAAVVEVISGKNSGIIR